MFLEDASTDEKSLIRVGCLTDTHYPDRGIVGYSIWTTPSMAG
jgi:hypothetical protein